MASDFSSNMVVGRWYSAESSTSVPAVIYITGSNLIVSDGDRKMLRNEEFRNASISSRVGNVPRRISFSDGAMFETPDNEGVDALLNLKPGTLKGGVHWLEKFDKRLIAITLACILLLAALFKWGVPVLVEVAVWATPTAVSSTIAQGTLKTLDESVFKPSELPVSKQQALTEGFELLVAHAQDDRFNYNLQFRGGGLIGPNAFALPDGTVILTDELVKFAGDDNDLLLGVIGHEIGHVYYQHSLRQIYRTVGITALIFLIAGDIGAGVEDVLIQGSALLTLSYSREAEQESDFYSVDLMRKAGKDPLSVSRFFGLLQKKLGDDKETSIFSTHPSTPERVQNTLDYAKEVGAVE